MKKPYSAFAEITKLTLFQAKGRKSLSISFNILYQGFLRCLCLSIPRDHIRSALALTILAERVPSAYHLAGRATNQWAGC